MAVTAAAVVSSSAAGAVTGGALSLDLPTSLKGGE
jgi:hypothetical protein